MYAKQFCTLAALAVKNGNRSVAMMLHFSFFAGSNPAFETLPVSMPSGFG